MTRVNGLDYAYKWEVWRKMITKHKLISHYAAYSYIHLFIYIISFIWTFTLYFVKTDDSLVWLCKYDNIIFT
jgi:hypothetical protein